MYMTVPQADRFGFRRVIAAFLATFGLVATPAYAGEWYPEEDEYIVEIEEELVRWLLDQGLDINARNEGGNTPLHHAASASAIEIVELLLDAGADVHARDRGGAAPLHYVYGSRGLKTREGLLPDVALLLLRHGADVNAQDLEGRTPVDYLSAGLWPQDDVVQVLVANGAEAGPGPAPTDAEVTGERNGIGLGKVFGLIGVASALAVGANADVPVEELVEIGVEAVSDIVGSTGNDASPRPGSGSPPTANAGVHEGGARPHGCEIPGYPRPDNPRGLGLSWCPASVDFQLRSFALSAAGAWCAIRGGSSSTPEQVNARHREIRDLCDRLDALAYNNEGPPCVCPTGYRPVDE